MVRQCSEERDEATEEESDKNYHGTHGVEKVVRREKLDRVAREQEEIGLCRRANKLSLIHATA